MVARHQVAGRRVEELVSADLDRALAPEEADALEAHVRQCAECRALLARQERIHERLRTLGAAIQVNDSAEMWTGITARRRTEPRRAAAVVARLAFAAVVLIAAALAGFVLAGRAQVASPPPAREVVASTPFDLPNGGSGVLTIEQGSALARARSQIGVGARAELQLAQPTTRGSAEIRFRPVGDSSYGILAAAPDLAGSRRLTIGGAFPRPSGPDPVTYEIWVHLETDTASVDSAAIVVDITATRRGEEARAR